MGVGELGVVALRFVPLEGGERVLFVLDLVVLKVVFISVDRLVLRRG